MLIWGPGLSFQPKAGSFLTLVTSAGVVTGRFAQFIDPFATGPGFTISGLVYEPNSVLLEFRTAASFALTPNQFAAASLLDAANGLSLQSEQLKSEVDGFLGSLHAA